VPPSFLSSPLSGLFPQWKVKKPVMVFLSPESTEITLSAADIGKSNIPVHNKAYIIMAVFFSSEHICGNGKFQEICMKQFHTFFEGKSFFTLYFI
jgi:hypothetical protein